MGRHWGIWIALCVLLCGAGCNRRSVPAPEPALAPAPPPPPPAPTEPARARPPAARSPLPEPLPGRAPADPAKPEEMPRWEKVLKYGDPGALQGGSRPEGTAAQNRAAGATAEPEPSKPAPKPMEPEKDARPDYRKGRTLCAWIRWNKREFLCMDKDPAAAKVECEKIASEKYGEPVPCQCSHARTGDTPSSECL